MGWAPTCMALNKIWIQLIMLLLKKKRQATSSCEENLYPTWVTSYSCSKATEQTPRGTGEKHAYFQLLKFSNATIGNFESKTKQNNNKENRTNWKIKTVCVTLFLGLRSVCPIHFNLLLSMFSKTRVCPVFSHRTWVGMVVRQRRQGSGRTPSR